LKQRITEAAANRDADNPLTITDIHISNNPFWFSRGTS
jgi:hypothetical protein